MTSRVEAPLTSRAWWIPIGVVAGIIWLAASTANLVAWLETGDGINTQLNATAVALAACLTISAVLLFVLRMLRQGQQTICAAADAATAVAVGMQESHQSMMETLATNERANVELCRAYAQTLQDLHSTISPQQLRALIKARDGRFN